MQLKNILALGGALVAVAAVPVAAAAAPVVTVRVEAPSHALLAPTVARTHAGSITKGGAPAGACSATSAAGALDVATHHKWAGTWSTSFNDYFITSILGVTESGKKYYWGLWVNNRYASAGACSTSLHKGDQVLFAADSVVHHEHPLGLHAPARASLGHAFTVTVVAYSDKGVAKPLAGATLHGAGAGVVTDKHGHATIASNRKGRLTLGASKAGYIEPAPSHVRVG